MDSTTPAGSVKPTRGPRRRNIPIDLGRLEVAWNAGASMDALVREFGASEMTLYRRLWRMGHRYDKGYTVDERAFGRIGPDEAWVIGLIWTDGYLRRDTVSIVSTDRSILEISQRIIGATGCIRQRKGKEAWDLRFTSRPIAERLRRLGLHQAKSFSIRWPKFKSDGLEAHFLRGAIDGDGSVLLDTRRPGQQVADLKVSLVTASWGFLLDVLSHLSRLGIRYTVAHRLNLHPGWHENYRIYVGRHDSLRRLHGLLYPDPSVPCLGRKRLPFDQWMITPRARSGRPSRD